MSYGYCSHDEERRRKLLRLIFAGVIFFITLILLIIFLVWIILRPTKPRFILEDANVYNFNISSAEIPASPTYPVSTTVSLSMQVTLSANNPNDRIGIYYQNLNAYASYRGQKISLVAALPNTYQGHNDFTVWSPYLFGTAVPVSPFLSDALKEDQNAGGVLVNVRVNGGVKWKVGTWVSGRYHIYANCPAYIKLAGDQNNATGVIGPSVKFQLLQSCTVDV